MNDQPGERRRRREQERARETGSVAQTPSAPTAATPQDETRPMSRRAMRERERAATGAIAVPGLTPEGAATPYPTGVTRGPAVAETGPRPTVVRRQPGSAPSGAARPDQDRVAPGRPEPAGPTWSSREPASGSTPHAGRPGVEGYFPSAETGAVPTTPASPATTSRWPFVSGGGRPSVPSGEPVESSEPHGQPVRSSVFGGGGARAAGTPTPMTRPPRDAAARPVPTTATTPSPESTGQAPLTWHDVRAAGGVPSPATAPRGQAGPAASAPAQATPVQPAPSPMRPTPAASTPAPPAARPPQPVAQPRAPIGWGTGSVEETQITPAVDRPTSAAPVPTAAPPSPASAPSASAPPAPSPQPSAWAGPPAVADAPAEVPIPQWGPVSAGPVAPQDPHPRGATPAAGLAWTPDAVQPAGDVAWGGITADDAEDVEPEEERSYSLLHWLVLLFLALVLGALIYLLVNQATGGPGGQSSASALLGTSLSHEVLFRSS
ncbi:hypothetical protein [Cellulomonas sp. P24]|uniref:hypothetical protein n=1 Tax=Cellulomonas sp. P24 TaxID=2885206 RepID=UPI00216AFFAC|nr:hypothetical protein [Cellulomonas sp. P24]MCR6494039.1 hypothetical protein [Cellulomonas sp. P24]